MPTPTISIMNSANVLAPLGKPGTFYEGRWRDVKITAISTNRDSPESVRKGLVGLVVPTIFTTDQLRKAVGKRLDIPEGTKFAYVPDVVEVLRSAGKLEEAEHLVREHPNKLDLYGFERGTYEVISDN